MPGGLLQIVSYGSQDLFLTGNPEITFFTTVYRRHTNFAIEAIPLTFDDATGFGMTSNVIIPKIGDLVYNMYLVIDIPSFQYTRQLDMTNINLLTDRYNSALRNYNLVQTFLYYNTMAYRDAYQLYLSNNITMSGEMMTAIHDNFLTYNGTANQIAFANMIADDYNSEYQKVIQNGGILFRYTNMTNQLNGNSTISYGNISMESVPDYWQWDPDISEPDPPSYIDKQLTMNIMDYLLATCKQLDSKYFNILSLAKATLADAYLPNNKFAWVDKLGHSIIDYIEFYIGGNKIDKHYGQWIDIWYELMGKKLHEEHYWKMIGNVSELTTFDRITKPKYQLKVPLCLFFNRYSGLALPMVALQYNDVSIRVKLRKFSECAYVESSAPVSLDDLLENSNTDLVASLLIEYIYLDAPERRKFAQSSHEYLIQQLQINYEENRYDKSFQMDLNFEHPCTGIVWIAQKTSFMQNPDGMTKCHWTTYTITPSGGIPILNSQMLFNNYTRFDKMDYSYFNYIQPYVHCHNTPVDGINCYWFALFPNEQQPSGTCNMSRLPKVRLQLTMDPYFFDNNESYTITVYAINLNILRILGGMGNTAYVK
jgi:hypothetical protein